MKHKIISRRKFVISSGLAISGLATLGLSTSGKSIFKDDIIKAGIIGTGSRGAGLASLLKEISGIELVACCDIIPEHLENGMSLAAKGAKAYTDYRTLLDDKTIDAVIIATPLFLHYPMAIAALDAGKHIYLEKSMTYDIPQALNLVKKVRSSNLVFQVGYQYRYYNLYRKVKEAIALNWLGKITQLECHYNRNSNWRVQVDDPKMERTLNWRMYREYCGGPLSELSAHQIDMVNYLLASHPLKVTGSGGIDYWKDGRDTYDNIHTIFDYPDGVKSVVSSVLSNGHNGYVILISGDKATVEIQREKIYMYSESMDHLKGTVDGVTSATMSAFTQGQPVELVFEKEGEPKLEPTIYALQDFFECIQHKKKPASSVETACDTSIAIHMGNRAADTETWQVWKPEYSI